MANRLKVGQRVVYRLTAYSMVRCGVVEDLNYSDNGRTGVLVRSATDGRKYLVPGPIRVASDDDWFRLTTPTHQRPDSNPEYMEPQLPRYDGCVWADDSPPEEEEELPAKKAEEHRGISGDLAAAAKAEIEKGK